MSRCRRPREGQGRRSAAQTRPAAAAQTPQPPRASAVAAALAPAMEQMRPAPTTVGSPSNTDMQAQGHGNPHFSHTAFPSIIPRADGQGHKAYPVRSPFPPTRTKGVDHFVVRLWVERLFCLQWPFSLLLGPCRSHGNPILALNGNPILPSHSNPILFSHTNPILPFAFNADIYLSSIDSLGCRPAQARYNPLTLGIPSHTV
eukprot:256355-Chlamydomonas_euryale.AAC.6